jgi:hypothetical protein
VAARPQREHRQDRPGQGLAGRIKPPAQVHIGANCTGSELQVRLRSWDLLP